MPKPEPVSLRTEGGSLDSHAVVALNGAQVGVPVTVTVASNIVDAPLIKETRTQRVRRLQDEAKQLAREQIAEFEMALKEVARMADEIAEGGDMYHIGAREICRRLAEELPRNLQTLQAIIKKA